MINYRSTDERGSLDVRSDKLRVKDTSFHNSPFKTLPPQRNALVRTSTVKFIFDDFWRVHASRFPVVSTAFQVNLVFPGWAGQGSFVHEHKSRPWFLHLTAAAWVCAGRVRFTKGYPYIF